MIELHKYDYERLGLLMRTEPDELGRAIAREIATAPDLAKDLIRFTEHLQVSDPEVRVGLSKALFQAARVLRERDLTSEEETLWAAIRMAAVFADKPEGLAPLTEFLGGRHSVHQVTLQAIGNVSSRGPLPHIPELHDLAKLVETSANYFCNGYLLGVPAVAAVAIASIAAARAMGMYALEKWRSEFRGHPLLLRQLDNELTELTSEWPEEAKKAVTSPERAETPGQARRRARRIVMADPWPRQRPRLVIGQEFVHPDTGHHWRVTDVGTRTFLALDLTEVEQNHPGDPSWLTGPPYAVVEHPWDEYSARVLQGVSGIEWEDALTDPCPAPHLHSGGYRENRWPCDFCGKVPDMTGKCTACRGQGKVLGECELSPNVWYDPCKACNGTGNAPVDGVVPEPPSPLNLLLMQARRFAYDWKAQEGSSTLDQLADAVTAYDEAEAAQRGKEKP